MESLTALVGPGLDAIPPISGAGLSVCLGAEIKGSSVSRLTVGVGAGLGAGLGTGVVVAVLGVNN